MLIYKHGDKYDLAEPARLLAEWRKHAGLEGSHDLLRRVYRDADALERFAAALGEQARWNLLRLHDLALALDLGPHPSLRRFAASIARAAETAGEEEASVPEHGEGRVQVMTVHAAKGLEKPAVLLVDAASPLRRGESRLRLDPGSHESPLLYGVTKRLRDGPELPPGQPPVRPGALAAAVDAARREAENEDADILYVALTRARDRLYVLGSRRERDAGRPNYHEWLRAAAAAAGLGGENGGGESPVRFASPAWLAEGAGAPGVAGDAGEAAAPREDRAPLAGDVVTWRPPPTHPRVELRTPSALASPLEAEDEGGQRIGWEDAWADAVAARAASAASAAAGPDDRASRAAPPRDPEEAAARGTAIHLWLRLAAEPGGLPDDSVLLGAVAAGAPAGARIDAASRGAAGGQAGAQSSWRAEALAEARAVAANSAFAWIFRPAGEDTRAWSEAPLLHEIPPAAAGGVTVRVHGAVDRLVRRGNRVAVIDYKSNRLPADPARAEAEIARLTAHYAPQLAAYRAAAAALFPDCEATAHVLFTNARGERGGQGRLVAVPSPTTR
jgi:ATP-dependent helicase/nuclease subunit A